MKRGPCHKCGGNDWREEQRGSSTVRKCRTCTRDRQRARRKRHPHENLYDTGRRRAERNGVPFTLTSDDVAEILADWTCAYCEAPVGSFHGGHARPNSATLDRVIPDEGYTRSNTVLACHRCNSAKAEHTPQSLRLWADRIETVMNRMDPTRNNDQSRDRTERSAGAGRACELPLAGHAVPCGEHLPCGRASTADCCFTGRCHYAT